MKALKLFILVFALSFSFNTNAQEDKKEIKLTVLVKDAKNNPVPGAVILIDNVRQKRIANKAGYFKIKLKNAPKEIAAFSPLLGVKKVKYEGKSTLIINIVKSDNEFTTGTPRNKVTDAIQFRDIYDYLRGRVAGVNVSTNNVIKIRGTSSWGGSKSPLYVLNGVQVGVDTFGDIVPTTIKSIKVLKGPETSIYGLRGANGVIEVRTTI